MIGQLCRVAKNNVLLVNVSGIKPDKVFDVRKTWVRRLRKEESVLVIMPSQTVNGECYVLTRHGPGWVNHDSLTTLDTFDEFIGL